jgi:hypothetical protein
LLSSAPVLEQLGGAGLALSGTRTRLLVLFNAQVHWSLLVV